MISRRHVLAAGILAGCSTPVMMIPSVGSAAEEEPFTPEAFAAAQDAGKPILVEIHASWCTTCAAQKPILSSLMAQPRFKEMTVLRVDFDTQKSEVKNFGARVQSTLIVFKGKTEVGRSVGDTHLNSIADLLGKAI